jgi:hypothetical protein
MKHLTLFLCVAFLYCMPVIAQDKAKVAVAPATSDEKDDEVNIKTKYDKSKDETTVEFTKLEITHSAEQQIFLSVSATFEGQKPKKQPEDIIVILSVASAHGYKYPDIMKMQVAADGKKLPEILMLNLDKRRMGEEYLETIATRMKYEIFKRMSQAKTIELKLQDLTLQLNEAQITKLRELEALLH